MSFLSTLKTQPPTRATYDLLVSEQRALAHAFTARTQGDFTPQKTAETARLSATWVATSTAQTHLSRWMEDIVRALDTQMPQNGPVGHDRRHLAKDLAAGFQHIMNDDPDALETLSLIPSFLHDTGRLVEAHFRNIIPVHETSADHALFSFGIVHQFAEKAYFKAIPREITDQILYAILAHSSRDVSTPMAHAVQSADREQLVGPEGIARLLSVQVATYGLPIVRGQGRAFKPKDTLNDDVDGLHPIEFYARYLYPQCSKGMEERAFQLRVISTAFLLLAAPDSVAENIFAPELAHAQKQPLTVAPSKTPLDPHLWRAACAEIVVAPRSLPADAKRVVRFVLGAAGNAVDADAEARLMRQFECLAPGNRARFTAAIAYAEAKRRDLDRQDLSLLQRTDRPPFSAPAARWAFACLAP